MPALLPDPGVEVEICLGVGSVQPGAVWDAATWDFNTWQQSDTSLGNWTDVTCDAFEITSGAGTSGADGVVSRWEAATFAFSLAGDQWDPGGPYAGLLGPGLPVRFRWRPAGSTTWHPGFLGYVDDDGFDYDPITERAHVAATDGTRIFVNWNKGELAAPVGGGETAAARVTRVADRIRWPAAARDISPGGVALASSILGGDAWAHLQQVADTDLGILWLSRAGNLAYRPQGRVAVGTRHIDAVIGCHVTPPGGGTVVIEPVTITGQQPTVTRNDVTIARAADPAVDGDTPVEVTVLDEASISRFLDHPFSRTDLLHQADVPWSTTVADAVIMSGAWPTNAPAEAQLSSRIDVAASALLLGLEPSLSVEVVDDNGAVWYCEPAGWSVSIGRREIAGTIHLLDVSPWYGSGWDGSDGWDIAKWGF